MSATAFWLACITLLRVISLIALSTLIWVPIGVLDRAAARLDGAHPARRAIPRGLSRQCALPDRRDRDRALRLNPDIWLTLLIMLGAQWYILFNVIAGASVFPNDLKEAAAVFGLRSWQWWRASSCRAFSRIT